jgi:membrane peptidoglycan carboxypeptidase
VALAANRDYGLDAASGQSTFGYPYDVMNKFGAGSTYKIFTSAAFLEKGGGINNVIETPTSYTSNVFTGGATKCPRTDAPNDGDNRKYCLSNASANYGDKMTLQQALATSPNTGFVKLEERVGMDAVVDMASRLGLRETMSTNMSGQTPNPSAKREEENSTQTQYFRSKPNYAGRASFTLSPAPVSPLEMANVSATIISGGTWCPPTPLVEVLDRNGKKLDLTKYEEPCEQAVAEPLANSLAQGMSQDDKGSGTSAGAAGAMHWGTRPIAGKTGTTQEYKSAAFVGATPQLAGATMVFNDGTKPRPICDSTVSGKPPVLCGTGSIFGGRAPARTFYEAMGQILAGQPELPLPPADPRYVDGGPESHVPDVVGRSQADATTTLQNAGYQVVAKNVNRADPKGQVVNQSPRGSALPGETITIYVSTGYVPAAQPEQPSTENPPPSDGGGGGGGGGDPGPGGGGEGDG